MLGGEVVASLVLREAGEGPLTRTCDPRWEYFMGGVDGGPAATQPVCVFVVVAVARVPFADRECAA